MHPDEVRLESENRPSEAFDLVIALVSCHGSSTDSGDRQETGKRQHALHSL